MDQLREKALLALEEVVQEARYRPVRRTLMLRFALAYLWSCKQGKRDAYDDFWRHVASESYWRFSHSDQALSTIYQGLGLERDHDLSQLMWARAEKIFRPTDGGKPLPVEWPPP